MTLSAPPFDAVLFDCDGVLVDSEPITNRVLCTMLNELGWPISFEDTIRTFTGKMVRDEAARIHAHTGYAITSEWLAGFRERRNAALETELVAVDGAVEAVRAVQNDFANRIAVASGADRAKIVLQLDKVGLADCFAERLFSGHEMARSKPFPDVYLAAAAALGVPAERCAVVEDSVTGAAAGVAAGATVFGYSPGGLGHSSPAALRQVGVAHVFADMRELPELLRNWSGSIVG